MSKRTHWIDEVRAMDPAVTESELESRRKKLFMIRVQQMTGQVDNHRQLRTLKREIAQLMTVRNEAQTAGTAEEEKA
ncbi:MAG: 50S ribosomal protein L29 [Candidatus Dormibacteria bacterium]